MTDQEEPEAPPSVPCLVSHEVVFTCIVDERCLFFNVIVPINHVCFNVTPIMHISGIIVGAIIPMVCIIECIASFKGMAKHIPRLRCLILHSPLTNSGFVMVQHRMDQRRLALDDMSRQKLSLWQINWRHAILDTGASRCIIGDKTLDRLCQSLPPWLSSSLKNRPSQVKFRFGNNQTTDQHVSSSVSPEAIPKSEVNEFSCGSGSGSYPISSFQESIQTFGRHTGYS